MYKERPLANNILCGWVITDVLRYLGVGNDAISSRTVGLPRAEHNTVEPGVAFELVHDSFAYDLAGKSRNSALITREKFQKEHSRQRRALGKKFGIAEG